MSPESNQELEQAKEEIQKLREEVDSIKNQKPQVIIKEPTRAPASNLSVSIEAKDLEPFLTGVVEIDCDNSRGSGSLVNLPGIGYIVMTNQHVVSRPFQANGLCYVYVHGTKPSGDYLQGIYQLDVINKSYEFNNFVDSSFLTIEPTVVVNSTTTYLPLKDLNYKIGSTRKCPSPMSVGAQVIVIGYPAFAVGEHTSNGITGDIVSRTATDGIISSLEKSKSVPYGPLPYPNYYVSAKIDSGNSGGIAISKDNLGICILGIPTWVSLGNYETQGIVQNIHNIYYSQK